MSKKYSELMIKIFSKNQELGEWKIPVFYRLAKTTRNPDRNWFQFWKPKMTPNPNYIGDNVKFDIVRGKNDN